MRRSVGRAVIGIGVALSVMGVAVLLAGGWGIALLLGENTLGGADARDSASMKTSSGPGEDARVNMGAGGWAVPAKVTLPPLTLEGIFKQPPDLSALPPADLRTVVVTGDVIPARGANWRMATTKSFGTVLDGTAAYLRDADVTMINLEAPLTKQCPVVVTGMRFCGDQRFVEALLSAEVDVVGLANNHSGNFGPQGFRETVDVLSQNGFGLAYDDVVALRTVRGLRFAFLAFNGVGPRLDRGRITRLIAAARSNADVVLVQFHWGKEYTLLPETSPGIAEDNPRDVGRYAIDAGADLVLGNHPHWVQGVEFYRGKLITYAHGNFLFDQTWSPETQEGVVGKYTFDDRTLVAVEYRPVHIDDGYKPRFLGLDAGAGILDRMWKSSEALRSMAWPRP